MARLNFNTLSFCNFKNFHGKHTLKLAQPSGLYLICGKNKINKGLGANGVGKSSIWDALFWLLWGKTIRDGKPGAAVVPWTGDKDVLARVSFNRDLDNYIIKRTRNPNTLSRRQNAEQSPHEIAQDEVAKTIGMSEEMFRRTVILGQFGTLFLDMRPDAQAQMFSEALGLDLWLTAAKTASEAIKEAWANIQIAEIHIASQQASLKEVKLQIKQAEEEADRFDQDTAAKIKKLKRGIAQMETDLIALNAKKPERVAPYDDAAMKVIADELAECETALTRESIALENAKTNKIALESTHKTASESKTCPECHQPVKSKDHKHVLRRIEDDLENVYAIWRKYDRKVWGLARVKTHLLKRKEEQTKKNKRSFERYAEYVGLLEKWTAKIAAAKTVRRKYEEELVQVDALNNTARDRADTASGRRDKLKRELKQLRERMEEEQRKEQQASFWAKAFKEIRLSIIDDVLLELEVAATRHAELLGLNDWRVEFQTERETKSGLSYKFTTLLYPPGMDKPVKWESYSGGESQRLQLAVTFGLSEVLLSRAGVDPNIEILDEPTRGLSPEGISDLLEHLRDRALELNRTIYIVDHHALDRGMFDGTLLVTNDKAGSSFAWQ